MVNPESGGEPAQHPFSPLTWMSPDGEHVTDWCGWSPTIAAVFAGEAVADVEVCGRLAIDVVHVGEPSPRPAEVGPGDQVVLEASRPVTGRATLHTVDVEQMPAAS